MFKDRVPEQIGKYGRIALLGQGGLANVYRGADPDTGITVAIKVLKQEKVEEDPIYLDLFINELRIHSNVSHPNIVRYIDHGYVKGSNLPYIVMEYLSGDDLDVYLEREKNLTLGMSLDIFKQIGRALDFVHSQGILHLDLSSSNIRVTSGGTAKLMDFGIAHSDFNIGALKESDAVFGHPHYIAPEVLDKSFSVVSDVYSLGIVLYEVLTQEVPFAGDTLDILAYQIRNQRPAPVNQQNPSVPMQVSDLVARMIEKAPERRFKSIAEVLQQLESVDLDALALKRRIYEKLEKPPVSDTGREPRPPSSDGVTKKSNPAFLYVTGIILGLAMLILSWKLGWWIGKKIVGF